MFVYRKAFPWKSLQSGPDREINPDTPAPPHLAGAGGFAQRRSGSLHDSATLPCRSEMTGRTTRLAHAIAAHLELPTRPGSSPAIPAHPSTAGLLTHGEKTT